MSFLVNNNDDDEDDAADDDDDDYAEQRDEGHELKIQFYLFEQRFCRS